MGARLKDLRLDAGITGVELARRHGWNKSKVSKIEHGTQNPSDADIGASALINNTDGAEVMNEQLDCLLEVDQMPYVSIGILPPRRRRTLFPGEGFYMFDESLVRQEFWSGAFKTSRPENIAHFARIFAGLRAQAVFGSAAHRIIDEARDHLE